MALVLLVIFFRSSISMFQLLILHSIKTGTKFCLTTASALDIIVKLGIKT